MTRDIMGESGPCKEFDIIISVENQHVQSPLCRQLSAVPGDRLKEKGRIFREGFLAKLALLLRGTVSAPPERFGETLADEHIRGGTPSQGYYPVL